MLKIKDIKNAQVFYGKASDGSAYRFKAWGDARRHDGFWEVECTDLGDYCYTFNDSDEDILYATEEEVQNA